MSDGMQDLRPGGLEVLSSRLNLAELDLHGGEGLWEEVARFLHESDLEAQVDAAMSGRSAPRVWAIMESPGSGPGAAAAGLGVARVLADRGQAVVLLDGDEQESRITRWLGRNEMEGWIDMIRFGASLHAASDALPSDNRRGSVLGVGSFAPTGVTPDEVTDLLGRLRRQADDLVLVLPAKLRSQPWFEAAHVKLLCWDLLTRSAADTEKIIIELDRMGARPDALLGFGVEEYAAIQGKLTEDDEAEGLTPLPPEEPEAAAEPVVPAEPASEEIEVAAEQEPVTPEPEPTTVIPPPAEAATVPEVETPAEPETADADDAPPRRRRSSGIFVFVAAVAVVCLVMLGVFLAGQRRGPDGMEDQPVAAANMEAPRRGTQQSEAAPEVVAGEVDIEGLPADENAAEQLPDAGETTLPPEQDAAPVTATDPPVEPGAAVMDDAHDAATVAIDEPVVEEITPPPAVEPETVEPSAPVLDMASLRKPVGQDGWALWLYSQPEEALAEADIRELHRRGMVAEYRAVEIKDKGRWWRVYVGSYPDRNAARAAVPALKDKLKHDWVVPVRY